MSCSCNSNPCLCVPACLESCPEVLEYSASNINLAGVGVYDSQSGNEFQFRGVRSGDGVVGVALNADFHTIDLTLPELSVVGTKVFTNAANRALTIPAFNGQLGVQIDTDVIYYSTGLAVGNWATDFTFLSGKTTPMANATIVQVANLATVTVISPTNNSTWDFENLDVNFDNCDLTVEADSSLVLLGPTTVNAPVTIGDGVSGAASLLLESDIVFTILAQADFSGSIPQFTTGANFTAGLNVGIGSELIVEGDLDLYGTVSISGALITADSVLTTGVAGVPSSKLINTFLSTTNTSAYGAPTGSLLRTALAAYAGQNVSVGYVEAEAQATDDAVKAVSQTLAALITDLKATLKPT